MIDKKKKKKKKKKCNRPGEDFSFHPHCNKSIFLFGITM